MTDLRFSTLAAAFAALSTLTTPALAERGQRVVLVPDSSIEAPADAGARVHTNVRQLLPAKRDLTPASAPSNGVFYETPASLACIYGLVTATAGCNPATVTQVAQGGSRAVAIVDAYDDPTAMADLAAYSQQFGLPAPTASSFQVIYASGTKPSVNTGWQGEEAMDVQVVHALAPKAKIILVEAASSGYADMMAAEQVAARAVVAAGGGEVSNSWGGSEFSSETNAAYSNAFTGAGVVFFASTGDDRFPSFPAVLPSVVAVGGTTTGRSSVSGAFQAEASWTEAGAGPSLYVPRPGFQSAVASVVGSTRGVPDVAMDANPETGAWVRLSGSWYVFGGTSLASPLMAAITNAAGHFAVSTAAELTALYANLGTAKFHDVQRGTCGQYQGLAAGTGYDFCSGIGSPAGLTGE